MLAFEGRRGNRSGRGHGLRARRQGPASTWSMAGLEALLPIAARASSSGSEFCTSCRESCGQLRSNPIDPAAASQSLGVTCCGSTTWRRNPILRSSYCNLKTSSP
jgi:hypothetical protein